MDYKPWFWGLDPLFAAKIKLNICDVLALQRYEDLPDVYRILNHPVMMVHVMGDVVSISKKQKLILYELDDGSGVLPCCQWRVQGDSDGGLFVPRLGQLVSAFGAVSEFRECRQIKLEAMCPEEDPNSEALHWLEVAQLKRTVYSKPFSLPSAIATACGQSTSEENQRPAIDVLKETVFGLLRGRSAPFTLAEAVADVRIVAAAEDTTLGRRREGEEGVKEKLDSVLRSLLSEGALIPVATSGAQGSSYECLSEERHLHPVIVGYIARKLQNKRSAELGVPEEWVVQYVCSQRHLSAVPPSTVRAAIRQLVDCSRIYPVTPSAYKVV